MHIHLVQYDIAWEDKTTNFERVALMLADAGVEAGGLIVLPELGDVGFSRNLQTICDDRSRAWAASLARETRCWVQHGWAEVDEAGRGHNIAGVFAPDGRLIGNAEKLHPFTFAREHETYDAGDAIALFEDVCGACLCPMICYDLRFPEAFRCATAQGAEVFTVTASWPRRRADHWHALCVARAIENQAIVAACNRVGADPFLDYHGGSLIIGPKGEVLAQADEDACVLSAEVDVSSVTQWRETFPRLGDMRCVFSGSMSIERFR